MSVIVAIKENGVIYMGADSQTTAGRRKRNYLNETAYKVARLDNGILVGFCGRVAAHQTILSMKDVFTLDEQGELTKRHNQQSTTASYAMGGLVGMVYSDEDVTSKINYCITYDNTFNTTSGAFGYMAGKSTANNSFGNCYFKSNIEKAVNGSSMNGCTLLRELSLGNIGDAEFNKNWTTDSKGNVILKKHS